MMTSINKPKLRIDMNLKELDVVEDALLKLIGIVGNDNTEIDNVFHNAMNIINDEKNKLGVRNMKANFIKSINHAN